MVTILPPKTNAGSDLGKAIGRGWKEGSDRAFEKSQLNQAFDNARATVQKMEQSGEYNPSELFFALGQAGAGIPGWSQTVSEGFPVLSQQIQRKILNQQRQKGRDQTGHQDQNMQVPNASQSISEQQFSNTGNPTRGQRNNVPVQQLPSDQPIIEGQAGVPSLQPSSLAEQGAQLYENNLASGMNPQEAMSNAIAETGLKQQDIQNQMTAAKTTQALTVGQKGISESFKNLAIPEIERMFPQVADDAQAENEFWRMSEEYQNLSDPQRIAKTLDKWVPWYNEKKAVDNVMTPNLIQRWIGQGKGMIDNISRSIKPFVGRGRAEQEYAVKQLTNQGLSLPESYEAVYPTSPKAQSQIQKMGQYPGLSKSSPLAFEARKGQLEKEGRMIEELSAKLPKILGDNDSLMSLLYSLMKQGWTQQAFVQAIDKSEDLELNPRQQSEKVQLGQDMTPGFWDILKQPGVF